jgi:hypothetical protein
MNITRKQRLLEQLNLQIQHFKDLQATTEVKTWAVDEAAFEQCRESVAQVLKKIYKGNAAKKVSALNDAIDNQGGIIHVVRPTAVATREITVLLSSQR